MPERGIVLCGSLSLHAVALGAVMHEAGYRALDLRWRYVPFELEPSALEGALTGMRALSIRGFGISMPFKQQIMALLDDVDPTATRIGAVNTVVNEGGRLVGHNTDWVGASRALAEALPLEGAEVLLLGAGGAARAVAFGLLESGCAVTLANRTESRGRRLADEIGAAHRPWSQRGQLAGFDAVVNATALGMADVAAGSPLESVEIPAGLVVMDIVYRPLETPLLAQASKAGARAIDGRRMLLHQAARQLELYTGLAAPLKVMGDALDREIDR